MNRYKKLTSDTLIFAISNFSSKVLVFLLLPLYTNCLTTTEYGVVDLINNITNVLFPILSLSVIEGLLRFTYEKNVKRNEILCIGIISIIFSILVLLLMSPLVYLTNSSMKEYWIYLLFVYSGYSISTTLSYYLRGINCVKAVAIQGIMQTAITVVSNIILLLFFNKGLFGYILSLILSYYITAVLIVIKTKIYMDFNDLKLNITLLKSMLKYCIPMIPSKIAWWINNSADKYYIIALQSIAQSGLYSVAHKIPSMLTVITEIFNQAWQISAIEIYTSDDEKSNGFYGEIHQYYILFTMLGASFLIILSQILGGILFAKDYFVAWTFVPPLIVAAVFSSLSGFYHSIFRAAKMSKVLCITVVSGTIVNLILNYILICNMGTIGAAYATMLAFLVEWIISYIYARKCVELKINNVKVAAVSIIIIIESFVMGYNIRYKYYVSVICFLLVFLLTYKAFKAILLKLYNKFLNKKKAI